MRPFIVESVRPHAPFLLIRFQEVTSLEQAQELRNAVVSVEERWLPPVRGEEFYYYQVIGLKVLTTTGEDIGRIAQVFFSGGHDVWVVRQDKKEHLIPVTEEIVHSIDIAGGHVVIEPMEGLLNE
jgi:16S rRNA processing protein RimM